MVVRYLGARNYGYYASAVAVTSLVNVLTDFGLQQAIFQLGTNKNFGLGSVLRAALVLNGCFSIAAIGIVRIWFAMIPYESVVENLALLLSIGFFQGCLVATLSAGLQVRGAYGRLSIWNIMYSAAQWCGTLFAIAIKASVSIVVFIPLALTSLTAVLMLIVEGEKLGIFLHDRCKLRTKDMWTVAWQFGVANIMYQGYAQAPSAILSAFRSPLEVGQYSAAARLVSLPCAIPGIVFNQVLYPRYFAWAVTCRHKLQIYYTMMSKFMLMVGALATCSLVLFGAEIIKTIFGNEQLNAVYITRLLALNLPLYMLASSPGALLTTDGHITAKIPLQGFASLVSVALNLLFVPRFGAVASAWLSVSSYAILTVLYSVGLSKRSEFRITNHRAEMTSMSVFVIGCIIISMKSVSFTLDVRLAIALVMVVVALAVFRLTLNSAELAEARSLICGKPRRQGLPNERR